MMTSRERILAALRRELPDRLPMCETDFWPQTLDRWRQEGFPEGADPVEYFGLDRIVCVNDLFDPSFGLPETTVEETPEYRVHVDRYGKTVKTWLTSHNAPAILRPALTTWEEWERLKPTLTAGPGKFNNAAAEAQYQNAREAGHFIAITPAEPMWFVVENTMGFEDGLLAMASEPDLVADMVATYADYVLNMLTLTLQRGYRFDAIWFWSDLCYRNGMLFSPAAACRFVLPHWRRFGEFAREHEMRFMFHCDGNIGELIPLLIEAGCHAIQPIEARAGNDVRDYKRRFGQEICFIGNINADVVASGDFEQIEREVADKIPVAAAGGGYIYHIDHSVPPTVSLAAYRHLLECVRRCQVPQA